MPEPVASSPDETIADGFVPALRDDNVMVRHGNEIVAWSAIRQSPIYLDPVAAVLHDVVDGEASVGSLIEDAQAALGIDYAAAEAHVRRSTQLFHGGGLLTESTPDDGGLLTGALFHAHDN